MDSEKKAISEIAAAIAHEVKNPIALVSANIDLMELKDKNKVYENNYIMMRRELLKINELMMDFINLTEPFAEEGETVYLYPILAEFSEIYTAASNERIKINLLIKNKAVKVNGKEKSLRILFSNIIKNAVEAIEGTGFVNIELKEDRNFIVLEFKDSGKGICEKVKSKIGEKHFTTKKYGSGLGILICRKIAEEHRGDFTLCNWEGGCSAVVRLPKP